MHAATQSPTQTASNTASLPNAQSEALFGRYRLLLDLFLIMMLFGTLLRVALLTVHVGWSELTPGEALAVLIAGLRFDALISMVSLVPQLLHFCLAGEVRTRSRRHRVFAESLWSLTLVLLPVLCLAEILFFEEFDSRLNYIAFEYLVYPKEVCCNIQQSYPMGTLLTLIALIGGGLCWTLRGRFHRFLATAARPGMRPAFPAAYLLVAGLLFSHTRVNHSEVTSHRVANQCALNGVYSFGYHAWTCRFEYDELYLTSKQPERYARLRELVAQPDDQFETGAPHPLDRIVHSDTPENPWNVVVILEESLGADYVECLGGKKGLTPNLDRLAQDGLMLDNFYATGNRTARALEAVLTALPPIPTESILKRDKSSHVFTLANVLAARGYERLFMTGGAGSFDGVRDFMTANGFNRFLEQDDILNPAFTNAWGASDEDLFRRGLEEMDVMAKGPAPFLSVLLTVSNHRPFTYPEGRIDLPASKQTRSHAVKYADWALGQFFAEARKRDWFSQTLFVVMGDHGARVYGEQQFPMKSYRIPVVMLMPEGHHKGQRLSTLGSSIDITPTILGALGGSYPSVFFGRDLRRVRPETGFALMQHNHEVALLTASNRMTILGSGRRVWESQFDPRTYELLPQGIPNSTSVRDTIAFFQSAYELYYAERCYPQDTHDTFGYGRMAPSNVTESLRSLTASHSTSRVLGN